MYFVIHIIVDKLPYRGLDRGSLYTVVPKTWIFSIDDHWEKFVNKSLNRNQRFLCFYNGFAQADDDEGRPNVDYVPDFSIPVGRCFPDTGCYYASLVYYKGIDKTGLLKWFMIIIISQEVIHNGRKVKKLV